MKALISSENYHTSWYISPTNLIFTDHNLKLTSNCKYSMPFILQCKNLISSQVSCSWHQTTQTPILFSPIISTNFSQFELLLLKKKTNFLLVQNRFNIRGLVVWYHKQDVSLSAHRTPNFTNLEYFVCLLVLLSIFPDKSFELIPKYTQKCQYSSLY